MLIASDPKLLWADNEATDRTAQVCRLFWVFAGGYRTKVHFLTIMLNSPEDEAVGTAFTQNILTHQNKYYRPRSDATERDV